MANHAGVEGARGSYELQPESSLSGPALRTFFNLAELEAARGRATPVAGRSPESTTYKWKRARDGAQSRDTLERISYLLGVFKALTTLFPQTERAGLNSLASLGQYRDDMEHQAPISRAGPGSAWR
jgi:hypothetical protein